MNENLNYWRAVGPTHQRLYPCGALGVLRHGTTAQDPEYFAIVFFPGGECDSPCSGSLEMCQKSLDKRFDPQPDIVRRTTEATYFEHNGRAAVVVKVAPGGFGCRPLTPSETVYAVGDSRDDAEQKARAYVLNKS